MVFEVQDIHQVHILHLGIQQYNIMHGIYIYIIYILLLLLFCIAIHDLVSALSSEFKVFYLDDGTIGGSPESLTADLRTIEEKGQELGLCLNVMKSELICTDRSAMQSFLLEFPGLQPMSPNEAVLLGSPLGDGSMTAVLESQLQQLKVVGERLCYLQTHDALTILRNSFAIPKLLHILRTSPAFMSPLLLSWDNLLLSIFSRITNIDFNPEDPSWIQATLPVRCGGLGIRRASFLAPSAFLASAEGASVLVRDLLPVHLANFPISNYPERDSALATWSKDLSPLHTPNTSSSQRMWEEPRVASVLDSLLATGDQESTARLLAASSNESGAWLHAPPISSLGLRMSNDAVRIAVGLRVGAPLCQPHTCAHCGKGMDQFGRHGLSCKSSQGRRSRHQAINNIVLHSLASANIPSRLEPSGLHRSDGKRPDGVSLVPWSAGKYLVWDATCVDTFCPSNLQQSKDVSGGAAAKAEGVKTSKYSHLDRVYNFQPIAFETCGSMGPSSEAFLRDLGRRLRMATGEPKSYTHLLQRLSVAIQVGNAASVMGTLPSDSQDIDFDVD